MFRGPRAGFRFDYLSTIVLTLAVFLGHACSQPAALQAADNNNTQTQPRIKVLPEKVTLTGKEARHRLLVQKFVHDELGQQVAKGIEFSTSNAKVVKVVNGELLPVADGEATITARVVDPESKQSVAAMTNVVVEKVDAPHVWSFQRHVQPVLTKSGCNGGACHGALAGKGGFRLSLRGYDSNTDHHTITRQARGRRIEKGDPGRSLLLAKPSGGIPHKGGLRFTTDSNDYRILAEWISQGATQPNSKEAVVETIEVLPRRVSLHPDDQQQLVVRARYSDGTTDDVTQWTKFISTNDAVASVDKTGSVSVIGYGEGAVTAIFSSKIAIARITSPYANEISEDVFAQAGRANFVDELVLAQLKRLNLPPSPSSDDATFLRRVMLDTIGILPKPEEVREFLADESPQKRNQLIDSLLARPEFVDYWTYKWSDILLINGVRLRPKAIESYYKWVRQHVEANTPWDEFVQQIITAQGSSYEEGATNFYALHQEPEQMAENACQAFLGLSIGCAKCHNHPLEKWTNNQYYGLANMFARVRAKGWGGSTTGGNGLRTLFVDTKGDLIQPLTGKPQPPSALDGQPLAFDDPSDRRVHLAQWMTSPENPYFSRSIANRVWANFMGVGLVESVDDLRVSNPASNDELLEELASYVVEQKFDLKALIRVILQSETYQRSSETLPENKNETRFYSHYYPRRMMAEVMLDAISQATHVPTKFDEIDIPGSSKVETKLYPTGTRAIQLYDSAVKSYFLKTFGRNERAITCECERSDEPSMVQVLHLSNGDTINKKLQADNGCVKQQIQQEIPNDKIVEQAYLSALSRLPRAGEREKLTAFLDNATPAEKHLVIEDLYWSILTSREFLFNH